MPAQVPSCQGAGEPAFAGSGTLPSGLGARRQLPTLPIAAGLSARPRQVTHPPAIGMFLQRTGLGPKLLYVSFMAVYSRLATRLAGEITPAVA